MTRNLIIAFIIPIIFSVIVYQNTNTIYHNHYDDSYITYRYAVNLSEHGKMVFNPGEKVDSASSYLFTFILAAIYKLGIHNMETISCFINMIALGLIVVFVMLSVYKLTQNEMLAFWLAMIASCHGFISGWAVLGMDTVFFATLLCAWAWAVIEKKAIIGTIITVLVFMCRHEGLLLLPIWCIMAWKEKYHPITIVAPCVFAFLFHSFRVSYYDTLIPHAYMAKNLIKYYQSNPQNILNIWKNFAVIAPVMAVAGMVMNRKTVWIGIYVIISAASCLMGLHSDWARYTVHLFPLMIISGAVLLKNKYITIIVCSVLIFQGLGSIRFMRHQATRLAVAQGIRKECGEWLQNNADKSKWVLSSDIGGIAYYAKDCKFIDCFGLTSKDVLECYQKGENAFDILNKKVPDI